MVVLDKNDKFSCLPEDVRESIRKHIIADRFVQAKEIYDKEVARLQSHDKQNTFISNENKPKMDVP